VGKFAILEIWNFVAAMVLENKVMPPTGW